MQPVSVGGFNGEERLPRSTRRVATDGLGLPHNAGVSSDAAVNIAVAQSHNLSKGVLETPPSTTGRWTFVKNGSRQQATDDAEMAMSTLKPKALVTFEVHPGKSCQGYAEEPPQIRDLDTAKDACLANDDCQAVECPHEQRTQCTLRVDAIAVDYAPADCHTKKDPDNEAARIHPAYSTLLKEYPFQQVSTQTGQQVNIILVRAPFGASGPKERERGLYEKYKDEILFMGISSFEDYPLDSMNPYSPRLDVDFYLGAFPGFLHMMREPEKHFPPHVKTILMSQSDFHLPDVPSGSLIAPKRYAFTYAATWPLGVATTDSECLGWSGYCKNWSFTKEALGVMCGEYNLTGVLVATQDSIGDSKCAIPDTCKGKVVQTSFLEQAELFNYYRQSQFAFVPQMHDASPRVTTQALVHDVPVLMNKHISGGWKYINENTGEFFHDMTDFRENLEKILQGTTITGNYKPRRWVLDNYGDEHAGKRFLTFVKKHFSHRVHLPKNTKLLLA